MFSYNPTTFSLKLKITPKTFLTVAGNSSSVCPASLLMASASLFSHFFKVLSSFGGKDQETTELPPKTLLIARERIVIERIVSTDIIVIPYSSNNARILSTKDASLSRTFLMVYLILAKYV